MLLVNIKLTTLVKREMGTMRMIKQGYLYQVTFMANVFPVNCYLVEEEDGLTLIDAALGFCTKGIMKAADTIGKPITKIVLTHAHEDHVGALDSIKELLPDVPVYISIRDHRLMNGDRSLDPHEAQTPIKGGVPKKLKTRANILLKEGDLIGSLNSNRNAWTHTRIHVIFGSAHQGIDCWRCLSNTRWNSCCRGYEAVVSIPVLWYME